jgi:hypothetical protein
MPSMLTGINGTLMSLDIGNNPLTALGPLGSQSALGYLYVIAANRFVL